MSIPTTCEKHGGFSLLELLLTLIILTTLSVIFLSGGRQGIQDRAMRQCEANIQKIHIALSIYAMDHDGLFPVAEKPRGPQEPLSALIPLYTTDTDLFVCPGAEDKPPPQGKPFPKRKISYSYYMGWRKTDPGQSPLLSDRQIPANAPESRLGSMFSTTGEKPGSNHHKYGGNVLFIDGSTKRLAPKKAPPFEYPAHVKLLIPSQ